MNYNYLIDIVNFELSYYTVRQYLAEIYGPIKHTAVWDKQRRRVLLESNSPLNIAKFYEITNNQYHILKIPDQS